MLIRQKILISSAVQVTMLALTLAIAAMAFSRLSEDFGLSLERSWESREASEAMLSGALENREQLKVINNDILTVVDGMRQTNQYTVLVDRKVHNVTDALTQLTAAVEKVAAVSQGSVRDQLYDIGDEAAHLTSVLRREVLTSVQRSRVSSGEFSSALEEQAGALKALVESLDGQAKASEVVRDHSAVIADLSIAGRDTISWSQSVVVGGLIALLMLAVVTSIYLARSVLKPIVETLSAMQTISHENADLTRRLKVQGSDEMAQISRCFNDFAERIQSVFKDIAASAHQLQASATETRAIMDEGGHAIRAQVDEMGRATGAISSMAAAAHQIAHNASDAASSAARARENVSTSREVFNDAHQSIAILTDEVQRTVQVIDSLEETSTGINAVVDIIKSVSEQTSLLALNAAIEAARAGEQGRGFAVVADEVRTLASRAESSSNEIREMIEQIQGLTQGAVQLMRKSHEVSSGTVSSAERAITGLDEISGDIGTIDTMNSQIAAASEEQSQVSSELEQRVRGIKELSEDVQRRVEKTCRTCSDLEGISATLSAQVNQFKL